MSNKVLSIIMVVAMLALGIATVSADGHIIQLPDVDPVAVEGDIIAAGSSTVFPLEQAIAEQFEADGYAGNFSIGSGGGFERFCEAGESDISNASRPIKDGEVENCNDIGRQPIEFVVGIDALAVTVSSENDFVTDVTIQELAQIFGEAELWSDVRAEWPEEPIQRFIPGTDSGTFDYFVEAVFDDSDEIILAASNTQLSEDDNVLVQGVSGSPYAVGFFGFAYYSENAETLNVASIEGVDATAETAQSFEYPLSRPLFVYSDASIMAEKPQVASFINYFLTNVNDVITEVGYFPLSDEALNESKAALAQAAGYEVEGHSDDDMMEVVELPDVDPVAVEGDIIAAGSSTVFPLEQAIAEQFEADGYAGNFTIDSIGSGGGFERFCEAGESDISNASRPIKDGEVENCNGIGRQPIEFVVGIDALAVTVSSENDFVTDVTIQELAQIFGEAELWSDVRAEWPEEPIQRFIPGTDSGTFDYFVEAVFDDSDEIILAASNIQLSEDDNVLVQGVSGSPYAVGFFGFAYYSENAETLNVASIEGVDATAETAQSFEYPLSRPLFVYSDASIMAEKPQVASFINYFLTNVNDVITEVGYFPLSDEALNESKAALAQAAGY